MLTRDGKRFLMRGDEEMRLSEKSIRFVKVHASLKHNPESVVSVLLRNGELRSYSIYNIPKAAKKYCEGHEYETWYTHNPELLTYVWIERR